MALILKYFLIEAYKIPTGSMQPQIMGDQVVGIFDRVLVNKLVYLMRGPGALRGRGLPQPALAAAELHQAAGRRSAASASDPQRRPLRHAARATASEEAIARKPDSVWRAVRKNLLPTSEPTLADLRIRGCTRRSARARVVLRPRRGRRRRSARARRSATATSTATTTKWVKAYLDPRRSVRRTSSTRTSDGNDVTDVEFAADVTPRGGRHGVLHRDPRVGPGPSPRAARSARARAGSTTDAGGQLVRRDELGSGRAARRRCRSGSTTRVSLRNVDDELVVELGGDVVLRRPYVTAGVDLERDPTTHDAFETRIVAGARGGMVG
jgi:hypothetical protein